MADVVLIKAGKKETLPVLLPRQLGFCWDTKEIYIGGKGTDGNLLIGAVAWGTDIGLLKTDAGQLKTDTGLLKEAMPGKLTASRAGAVPLVASDADLASVIATVNAVIGSLQAAGIMATTESEVTT